MNDSITYYNCNNMVILYYTILYYIIAITLLHYTILHYTTLYYTILFWKLTVINNNLVAAGSHGPVLTWCKITLYVCIYMYCIYKYICIFIHSFIHSSVQLKQCPLPRAWAAWGRAARRWNYDIVSVKYRLYIAQYGQLLEVLKRPV